MEVDKVIDELNKEYVQEITPEYLYLTIPAPWVCVYHKLLVYMADFGKTIIDDCQATCKGSGKNILSCWNLFQAAVAAHTLGQYKKAELFIDYIKKQLDTIYKGSSKLSYNNTVPLAITEDGKLKAIASCDDQVRFYVDEETGKLYEQYLADKNRHEYYNIKNDKLIYTDIN